MKPNRKYYTLRPNNLYLSDDNCPPTVMYALDDWENYAESHSHFVYHFDGTEHIVLNPERVRFSIQWLVSVFVYTVGKGRYEIVRRDRERRGAARLGADRSKVTNPHEIVKQRLIWRDSAE